jgi:hypothetical protein
MTNLQPKTIQIFLPDGSPKSIKIADMTNQMIMAVLFPRNKLKEVGARAEVKKNGIYFLFDIDEVKAKPIAYIGETDNCYKRIRYHNKTKEFWNYAIVISSKSNNFTKSHVKYLEYLCIKNANEIGRYDTNNLATPAKPHISESMEADLLDNYETIKILLTTLGYPIFEEIKNPSVKKKELLFCKGKEAKAEGDMVDDGFVVFKGSTANKVETNTAGSWITGLRDKLIESKILVEKHGVLIFSEDYLFGSASTAASVVLGRQANGWLEWKDREGTTIDKLFRMDSLDSK